MPIKLSLSDRELEFGLVLLLTDHEIAFPLAGWAAERDMLLLSRVLEGHVGVHLQEPLV